MVNCIHYKLQLNTWDGRWTWSHSLLFALTSLKSLSLHREPSLVFLAQTAPVSAVCAFYLRFVQYSQAGQWLDTRDTGRACHIVRGHVTSRDLCWRDSSSPRGLETCGGWVLGAGSWPQSWRGHASGDLSLGAALARTPHHRHGGQDIKVWRQKR